MSTPILQKTILRLRDRQAALLDQILNAPPMIRGSFTQVSTRCGKPSCWCAKSSKGHEHTRVTWSEQGKMTTRKVPREEVDRIKELTANYRKHRQRRRALARLHQQLQETIAWLETLRIEQARKPLVFLARTQKMSAASANGQQNPRQKQKRIV